MAKFCTNCGCEIVEKGSKFCTNCGTKIIGIDMEKDKNESTLNTESSNEVNSKRGNFVSEELIRIKCVGTTTLQERLLILHNDHIELLNTDKGTVAFNVNYGDVVRARGNDSRIFSNVFYLDLKNGESLKFSLDIRYDLNGNYYSVPALNTDIKQLSKTLPNYINKLIADFKSNK